MPINWSRMWDQIGFPSRLMVRGEDDDMAIPTCNRGTHAGGQLGRRRQCAKIVKNLKKISRELETDVQGRLSYSEDCDYERG